MAVKHSTLLSHNCLHIRMYVLAIGPYLCSLCAVHLCLPSGPKRTKSEDWEFAQGSGSEAAAYRGVWTGSKHSYYTFFLFRVFPQKIKHEPTIDNICACTCCLPPGPEDCNRASGSVGSSEGFCRGTTSWHWRCCTAQGGVGKDMQNLYFIFLFILWHSLINLFVNLGPDP